MGRAQALGLLLGVILLSLAVSGCLGGPSEDEVDLDELPSEYDTPQHDEAEGADPGLEDPDAVDPNQQNGTDPAGAQDGSGENTPAPAQEDTTGNESDDGDGDDAIYIGPPQARLQVRNSTGEPTTNAIGTAPFDARFFLDAQIAGDGIPYWSLRIQGSQRPIAEGNSLPVEINHRIIPPGEHTAILFVSDGRNHDEERVELRLERPPPPPSLMFEGILSGFWTPDGSYMGQTDAHSFNLDVPVEKITVNVTGGPSAFDLDFELVAPDGTSVEKRVGINEPTGTLFPSDESPIVVTDPAFTHHLGEWSLFVKPGLSVLGEYEATVSFA